MSNLYIYMYIECFTNTMLCSITLGKKAFTKIES